ncbi:hypothetical protein LMG28727_03737 [Paraburkholderia kirstenboschensis]|nr:hypothetical protein LMG28727_03737 [Paraburkholderia kirstenboschensis]
MWPRRAVRRKPFASGWSIQVSASTRCKRGVRQGSWAANQILLAGSGTLWFNSWNAMFLAAPAALPRIGSPGPELIEIAVASIEIAVASIEIAVASIEIAVASIEIAVAPGISHGEVRQHRCGICHSCSMGFPHSWTALYTRNLTTFHGLLRALLARFTSLPPLCETELWNQVAPFAHFPDRTVDQSCRPFRHSITPTARESAAAVSAYAPAQASHYAAPRGCPPQD